MERDPRYMESLFCGKVERHVCGEVERNVCASSQHNLSVENMFFAYFQCKSKAYMGGVYVILIM